MVSASHCFHKQICDQYRTRKLEICQSFLELSKIAGNIGTSKSDRTGALHNMICGAHYCKIRPLSCIPFTEVRETSQYGVQRFVAILSRDSTSKLGPVADGLACETSIAIVVKFVDSDLYLDRSYLSSLGASDEGIETKVRSKSSRHGILDGKYQHQAIILLMNTNRF